MFVVDTNILIHCSKKEVAACIALDEWIQNEEILIISTVVEAELLSWPAIQPKDLEIINDLLATFAIVPVNSVIARMAGMFRRTYKVHLIDAMIAATAYLHNAKLATRNIKDFAKIEEIELLKI